MKRVRITRRWTLAPKDAEQKDDATTACLSELERRLYVGGCVWEDCTFLLKRRDTGEVGEAALFNDVFSVHPLI